MSEHDDSDSAIGLAASILAGAFQRPSRPGDIVPETHTISKVGMVVPIAAPPAPPLPYSSSFIDESVSTKPIVPTVATIPCQRLSMTARIDGIGIGVDLKQVVDQVSIITVGERVTRVICQWNDAGRCTVSPDGDENECYILSSGG